MSVEMWVMLALLLAILVLLVVLLFWHRPRVELPAEWQDKLRALESLSQATQLAVAASHNNLRHAYPPWSVPSLT